MISATELQQLTREGKLEEQKRLLANAKAALIVIEQEILNQAARGKSYLNLDRYIQDCDINYIKQELVSAGYKWRAGNCMYNTMVLWKI